VTTVAVTGASGHLGRVLVPYLWERGYTVEKVGHEMPSDEADVVMHLAAPRDWRDADAVRNFAIYNERLARYSAVNGTRVIAAGSWWQYADGDAPALPYSRMKSDQAAMFDCTLVLFSVYGSESREGRGFIPQLLAHARGGRSLAGVSHESRDWIYATDACGAFRAALSAPDGIYEVATGLRYSPAELARAVLGVELPDWPDVPSCSPRYLHSPVPGWAPRTDVLDFLRRRTAAA